MAVVDHVGHVAWGAGVALLAGVDSITAAALAPLAVAVPREVEQAINTVREINGSFSLDLFIERYTDLANLKGKGVDILGFILGGLGTYFFI